MFYNTAVCKKANGGFFLPVIPTERNEREWNGAYLKRCTRYDKGDTLDSLALARYDKVGDTLDSLRSLGMTRERLPRSV